MRRLMIRVAAAAEMLPAVSPRRCPLGRLPFVNSATLIRRSVHKFRLSGCGESKPLQSTCMVARMLLAACKTLAFSWGCEGQQVSFFATAR